MTRAPSLSVRLTVPSSFQPGLWLRSNCVITKRISMNLMKKSYQTYVFLIETMQCVLFRLETQRNEFLLKNRVSLSGSL